MLVQQVVISEQYNAELQTIELDDQVGPEECLIETEFTVISSGTELANYTGAEPRVFVPGTWCAYPWRPGYGNVGVVRAVGDKMTRTQIGQRVFTLSPHAAWVKVSQEDLIVPVPDGLGSDDAAASRLAGVATTAAALAELRPNSWVVVLGLGLVGNLAAQAFRCLGARVIGVDPVESRRECAARCGIPHILGGPIERVRSDIDQITGGEMAGIVVDATGSSAVVLQSLSLIANLGQCILLGTPRKPFEADVTPLLSAIHLRNITMRGALEWCFPTYPPPGKTVPILSLYDKQKMIFDWIIRGEMIVEPLISHRVAPGEISKAYDGLLNAPDEYIGVLLDWRER